MARSPALALLALVAVICGAPAVAADPAATSPIARKGPVAAVWQRPHVAIDDFGRAELRAPDPVGQVRTQSAVGNLTLFQGRRLDPETGMYYFRARYYDPATGRFIQRDPVWDPGNVGNQYTFVGNNPVTLTDPSGQAWFLPALYMGAKWAAMAAVGVFAADVGVQHYTGHADQGFNWTGDQYGSPGALQISGTAAAYGFVGGFTFGAGTAAFGALGASPLAAEMLAGPLSVGAMDIARGEVSHPGWYALGVLAPPAIRGIASMGPTARGAATTVVDAMARKRAGRLGGQLYGAKRLQHLRRYLARRGVDLAVDDALASEAAGAFRIQGNLPRPQMILRSNPTRYEVWHELGHYLHWRQLGRSNSAYAALPRAPTNNVPERFVYENVLNTQRRWGLLNPEEQAHASQYYMDMGGIR